MGHPPIPKQTLPDSQPAVYPVRELGVDWLTITCSSPVQRSQLRELAAVVMDHERDQGNDVKPWRILGFEGLACGGVGFGDMDHQSLFRLSGPAAAAHWKAGYELSTNCSRIDLQVTISNVTDPAELILTHHKEALVHVEGWLRPPTVDLRLSNVTGPTLYLNKRCSDKFMRVYDKGSESKLAYYKGCVRYEVQFGGRLSGIVARRLARAERYEQEAHACVYTSIENKGLAPRFPTRSTTPIVVSRRRSDDSRRLAWLSRAVRPSVHTLLKTVPMHDILRALGLHESVMDHLDHPGQLNDDRKE